MSPSRLLWSLSLLLLVPFAASAATTGPGGWIGTWSPGIGDPTPIGWITAVAYLAAAALCFAAVPGVGRLGGPEALRRRELVLWWVLGGLLVFLGVNKQLDLQTAFTEMLRILAFEQGWYRQRRVFQEGFILGVVLWSVVALGALTWLTHRLPWGARIAALGTVLVGTYVVIRAASFHNVDLIINHTVLGVRMNWVFELGGIAVILGGSTLRLRQLGR